MKQYKNTVQTIQNTVKCRAVQNELVSTAIQWDGSYQMENTINTNTRIIKTPTHYKTQTHTHTHITKQVKTTTFQEMYQKKLSQYKQVTTV